jgi:prepilin-type N-terminal cleavage/methylation domain-containing protein/prepilin-type processing-associated H-X9-DG protein
MFILFGSKKSRGFTLIELLVVIAIIAVVIGLMLPAVQAAREAGRRMVCVNNLKTLGLALHNYHTVHDIFPSGGSVPVDVGDRPSGGSNFWVEILPYFEQGNLYERWDRNDNRNNVAGGTNAVQAKVIEILLCPSDPLQSPVMELTAEIWHPPPWCRGHYAMSSYGGNAGTRSVLTGPPPAFPGISRDGVFFLDSRVKDIIDGSSNTFLLGERYHFDPQYDVLQPEVSPGTGSFAHVGEWGFVAGPNGLMVNVTLHTAAPINYRMPNGGGLAELTNRASAFGSGHPGGANFAFADCSVRFVRDTTPLLILQALSTRQGGEVVSTGDY